MLRSILTAISVIATVNASFACTAVDIIAVDKSVIAGRTMEWAFDMQWQLVSLPKGTEITLSAPPSLNLPVVKVNAKYPVVGVSAGVIPGGALLEGQNSEGLGVSGNFLPGFTEYQTVTAGRQELRLDPVLRLLGSRQSC
jgi:penicillin V acylase-like amidase (Ntn superfamily)